MEKEKNIEPQSQVDLLVTIFAQEARKHNLLHHLEPIPRKEHSLSLGLPSPTNAGQLACLGSSGTGP
jgi:hypothetical protein